MPKLQLSGRQAKPDQRDYLYLIKNQFKARLEPTSRRSRFWQPDGWWGNQLATPHCVGYAWAHWLEDGPVFQSGPAPCIQPSLIYAQAQRLDEWAGEDYDGTSVRGGAKYLKELGRIRSYYWAFDLDTVIQTVLNLGPVVVGTDWYAGMMRPDRDGNVRPSGELLGGHAYVLNGVDRLSRRFRLKNSWGRGWGQGGHAYLSFNSFNRLLADWGEACIAVEQGS